MIHGDSGVVVGQSLMSTTAQTSADALGERARLLGEQGGLEPGLWEEGAEKLGDLDKARRRLRQRLLSSLGPVRPPSPLVVLSRQGPGAAVHLAAAGYRVTLRLPTEDAVSSARVAAEASGVELCVKAGHSLDENDAVCDGVVLLDALPDGATAGALLERVHRALSPRGRLLILQLLEAAPQLFSEPAPWSQIELIPLLLEASFCPLKEEDLSAGLAPSYGRFRERAARLLHSLEGADSKAPELTSLEREWGQMSDALASGQQRCLLAVARRDAFCVRGYRPGDETQILEVFPRLFHVERDREHWDWKYRSNPWGGPRISAAYDEEGKLAAHYAAYPVPFYRDAVPEQEPIGHQVGDTMTEPRVRSVGRGKTSLLARCARHFYDRYCEGRIAFNYGFNTGNIQKFALRFYGGARRVGDVPLMVRDLKRAPLRPARRRSGPLSFHRLVHRLVHRLAHRPAPYRVAVVDEPDASFDRLFAEVCRSYGFLARRTARYLIWRYVQRPDATYRIYAVRRWRRLVGWGVFRREGERLRWGDALFHPSHLRSVELLLARAVEDAEQGEPAPERVEGWFTPRPDWWWAALVDLQFEPRPDADGLGMIYSTFLHDPGEAMADLYYTLGDGDLF